MKTEEEILKKIKELEGKRESGSHDVNERGRPFLFSLFLKKIGGEKENERKMQNV